MKELMRMAMLMGPEQGNGGGGELFTGRDWQDEQLAGELEGEWVEVVPGLVVEGTLLRAFATADDDGTNLRACYAVKGVARWENKAEAAGTFLLGEKAAFKQAIRELKLGTSVRLSYLGKEPITRNGKKTGMDMWKLRFQSKRDGTGETVEKALFTYWNRNLRHLTMMARPNPGGAEFVPF